MCETEGIAPAVAVWWQWRSSVRMLSGTDGVKLLPNAWSVQGVHVSLHTARAVYVHGVSLAHGQGNNKVSLTTGQKLW